MIKKASVFILICIFIVLGLLVIQQHYGIDNESEKDDGEIEGLEKDKGPLKLGYCETFSKYAEELADKNNLDLKLYNSSSFVLSALSKGKIDYAVIGRKAREYELHEGVIEKPLRDDLGYTLVSDYRDFIKYFELPNIEIHTALDQEEVEEFLSFGDNIVYHEELKDAVQEGDVVLIHWNDWNDDYKLFIPIDKTGKVEKFRTPILYKQDTSPEIDIPD